MNLPSYGFVYSHPKIEESLNAFETESSIYEQYAKQDADENKPKEQLFWRSRIFNPLVAKKEELINSLQLHVQPVAAATDREKIKQNAEKEVAQLQADTKYDEVKLLEKETELKKYKEYDNQKLIRTLVLIYLALAAAGDIYLTTDAFTAGKMSLLAALLLAVPAGIGVGAGAYFSADQYRKAKTPKQKKRILLTTTAAAAIFFGLLGYMRANHYNAAPDISTHTPGEIMHSISFALEGWQLALISFLLFMGAFFFSVATWVSEKTKKLFKYIGELKTKCKTLKKDISTKKQRIQEIENHKNVTISELTGRCEYAISTKKRIENIAKKHLAHYASINIAHRTDGETPDFLTHIPELQ